MAIGGPLATGCSSWTVPAPGRQKARAAGPSGRCGARPIAPGGRAGQVASVRQSDRRTRKANLLALAAEGRPAMRVQRYQCLPVSGRRSEWRPHPLLLRAVQEGQAHAVKGGCAVGSRLLAVDEQGALGHLAVRPVRVGGDQPGCPNHPCRCVRVPEYCPSGWPDRILRLSPPSGHRVVASTTTLTQRYSPGRFAIGRLPCVPLTILRAGSCGGELT